MNWIAEYACFVEAPQLESGSLESWPVVHCKFSSACDDRGDNGLGVAVAKRNGLLKEDMTSGRDSDSGKGEVRLRWCCDVDDIGLFLGEQLCDIGVPSGNAVANRQLLGHDRFQVADGAQLSRGNFLELLDVRIRDFATPNDHCLEAH
jgi:hypothetical protein